MLYTELLRLWDEAVKAVDARDWDSALSSLKLITEPTSRILFITASVHLALGQLDPAIKALDQVIAKDERLAVAFFQRAGAHMLDDRLEEALSDCIWAHKHMRDNPIIDYKQLGLRFKLYSWQVLYNAAAVHCRMGQWDKAKSILGTAFQERGSRGGGVEAALDSISRKELPAPLLVPEGEVFRPRKQDIEQLKERDFLGKAKVITSMIPNDDFGGFEPLRLQKPGYYQPKTEGVQDSRYMRVRSTYMARGPGELTVPGGGVVFIFKEENRDGLVTVIYDGEKGLLPIHLLEPADVNQKSKDKHNRVPRGIPLPPDLKPPTRPQSQFSRVAPPTVVPVPESPPPYTRINLSSAKEDKRRASEERPAEESLAEERHAEERPAEERPAEKRPAEQGPSSAEAEANSVVVKVHYRYTVALCVPLDTPYHQLQEQVADKLGQPASHLRLRHRQAGSQVLVPLDEERGLRALLDGSETNRATLWCQTEDRLWNRTILYQMVALHDYSSQGPEDLEFNEGDTIDILGEVNEEWLEGHSAGNIGIFPRCFAYCEVENPLNRSP